MATTIRFDEVLVSIDEHAASDRAVQVGSQVAALANLPLVIVTQIASEEARALAEEDLAAIAAEVPLGDVGWQVLLGEGPVEALVDVLSTRPRSLLCMSTHGRSAAGQLIRGSVAAEVVRRAIRPVLLVGPETAEPLDVPPIEEVIVCVDDAAGAERAVPCATALAGVVGARVALLRAQHEGDPDVAPFEVAGLSGVDWETVVGEAPAEAIADHVRGRSGKVLVVATRAPGVGARILDGSVGLDLAGQADCPVLAVGPEVS